MNILCVPYGPRIKNTFSQRVVNPWNDVLGKREVHANSTSAFKANFDLAEIGKEGVPGRRADRAERVADGTLYNRLYRGRGFYSIFP